MKYNSITELYDSPVQQYQTNLESFDVAEQEAETFKQENPFFSSLPDFAQRTVLGVKDVNEGLKDIAYSTDRGQGTAPWQARQDLRHQKQNDFRGMTNMLGGSKNPEASSIADEMQEYGGDMAMYALTGGTSLLGTGLRGTGKAVETGLTRGLKGLLGKKTSGNQKIREAIKEGSPSKTRKFVDETADDLVQTAESEFMHGKLREDDTKGILDSFSPQALMEESAFDAGLAMLLKGVAAPGRMAKARQDRKLADSRADLGGKEKNAIREQVHTDIQNGTQVERVKELSSDPYNKKALDVYVDELKQVEGDPDGKRGEFIQRSKALNESYEKIVDRGDARHQSALKKLDKKTEQELVSHKASLEKNLEDVTLTEKAKQGHDKYMADVDAKIAEKKATREAKEKVDAEANKSQAEKNKDAYNAKQAAQKEAKAKKIAEQKFQNKRRADEAEKIAIETEGEVGTKTAPKPQPKRMQFAKNKEEAQANRNANQLVRLKKARDTHAEFIEKNKDKLTPEQLTKHQTKLDKENADIAKLEPTGTKPVEVKTPVIEPITKADQKWMDNYDKRVTKGVKPQAKTKAKYDALKKRTETKKEVSEPVTKETKKTEQPVETKTETKKTEPDVPQPKVKGTFTKTYEETVKDSESGSRKKAPKTQKAKPTDPNRAETQKAKQSDVDTLMKKNNRSKIMKDTGVVSVTVGKVDRGKAQYNPNTGEIIVSDAIDSDMVSTVLDHELGHAITYKAYVDNTNGFKTKVDSILARSRDSFDGIYATGTPGVRRGIEKIQDMNSNTEIFADLFSDRDIYDALNAVILDPGKKESAWTQLKKWISKLWDDIVPGSAADLLFENAEIVYLGKLDETPVFNPFATNAYSIVYKDEIPSDQWKQPQTVFGQTEAMASMYLKGAAKKTWQLINALYEHVDKESKLKKWMMDGKEGSFIGKVLVNWELSDRPFMGPLTERLNRMAQVDKDTIDFRNTIAHDIQRLLDGKHDEKALGVEIMGTDLQSMTPELVDRMIDAGFDKDIMESLHKVKTKEMNQMMSDLGIKRVFGFNEAKKGLVANMLGIRKELGYRAYAVNNVDMLLDLYTDGSSMTPELRQMMNDVVSLQAAMQTDFTATKGLDKPVLKEIIDFHKNSVILFAKNEGYSGPQYRKGYIGGTMDADIEMKTMPKAEYDFVATRDGWKSVGTTDDGLIMAVRESEYLSYSKSLIPVKQEIAMGHKKFADAADMIEKSGMQPQRKGETLKQYNRRAVNFMNKKYGGKFEPVYSPTTPDGKGGRMINIRSIMSDKSKVQHLGYDTSISNAIANNIMGAKREVEYNKMTNEVNAEYVTNTNLDSFKGDDLMKNMGKNARYIMLKGSEADIKRKVPETVLDRYYQKVDKSIMPKELKGVTYVRKDYADEMVGYRNEYLSSGHTGRMVEKYWRNAVNLFRQRVIVGNPVAMMTNAIGNQVVLMGEGVSPAEIAKYGKEGYTNITRMFADLKDLHRAELKLDLEKPGTPGFTKAKARLDSIQAKLDKNDAYELNDQGIYQSMMNEIWHDAVSSSDMIGRRTNDFARKRMEKAGLTENQIDKMMSAGCTALVTPNSKSAHHASKFISYTDYISRYTMYKHKKNIGMDNTTAAKAAREAFVDYRKVLPKEINALRVNGVVPFATWAFRMAPYMVKQAANNPIKVAALYGTYLAASDETGYVGNVRVGGWMPQSVLTDTSLISNGVPQNIMGGEFPWEMAFPAVHGDMMDLDAPAMLGIRTR